MELGYFLFFGMIDKKFIGLAIRSVFGKKKLKYKFFDNGGVYVNKWKDFIWQNLELVPKLLKDLIDDLDERSREDAKKVIENILFFIPYGSKNFLLLESALDFIFDQKDREEQKKFDQRIEKIKTKYVLPYVPMWNFFGTAEGLYFIEDKVDLKGFLLDKLIIDGGGYIGDSLVLFMEFNPYKVLVFEPLEENIKSLQQTLVKNNISLDRVLVFKIGLDKENRRSKLFKAGSASTIIAGSEIDYKGEENIELVSLDDFYYNNKENFESKKIGCIKLDIEGNEYNAILGALKVIKEHRPILLISIYHVPQDFFYIKPLLQKEVENYRFMIRRINPYRFFEETLLIGYPEEIEKK